MSWKLRSLTLNFQYGRISDLNERRLRLAASPARSVICHIFAWMIGLHRLGDPNVDLSISAGVRLLVLDVEQLNQVKNQI